ncbi:tagatose 1,6-diphosphate aldolase [Ruegeria sp. SCP11]|uniref:tagatose 1,6-diphosphate aldolase n=1 Tax=Ruegeria sp. SCP11 TaxID=3141378 RepID=UPI00333D7279
MVVPSVDAVHRITKKASKMSLGKAVSLRRMTDDREIFRMTSLDQLPPIRDALRPKAAAGADPEADMIRFKRLVIENFQDHMTAMLLDPGYAVAACVEALKPDKGLFISLEDPYSPKTEVGATKTELTADWTVGKAKRIGGDAVKLLIWYRPDGAPDVNAHQQNLVRQVGELCQHYDIPFILELLAYPGDKRSDGPENTVLDSVATFAQPEYHVDAFLFESPVPAMEIPEFDGDGSALVLDCYKRLSEIAGRPWIMMSMGADMEQFHRIMRFAYAAGCSGYLAGRAYWLDALERYPNWSEVSSVMAATVRIFVEPLNALTKTHAAPDHAFHAISNRQTGAQFCRSYQDL